MMDLTTVSMVHSPTLLRMQKRLFSLPPIYFTAWSVLQVVATHTLTVICQNHK